MCNLTLNNVTKELNRSSVKCVYDQQHKFLANCYTTYMPLNEKLCIALNGTDTEGYFDCINVLYQGKPPHADGCYIQ